MNGAERRIAMVLLLCLLVSLPAASSGAELVGPGKIFVRFTNTRPDGASIACRGHTGRAGGFKRQ